MKKIIAVLCVLFATGMVFADAMIQFDYEGIGRNSWKAGSNAPVTEKNGTEFTAFNGYSVTALKEFDSKNENLHIRTGCTTGFNGTGLTILPSSGVSIKIDDFGSFVTELSGDLKFGVCLPGNNGIDFVLQTDLMLNFMKADRKGLYAAFGLTDSVTDIGFPSTKKEDSYISNYFGMKFSAGWRF